MSKLATNWDALLASVPANRAAALDANAKGTEFRPAKEIIKEWDRRSHAPFPTKRVPFGVDLTGLKVGRLTVIGLADLDERKAKSAAWVVRCACGYYEIRRSKSLRSPAYAARAMCSHCDYQTELRAGNIPARSLTLAGKPPK